MKTPLTKIAARLATAVLLLAACGLAGAQSANTIFARTTGNSKSGSDISINLVSQGPNKSVAGFAFKISYDPSQVEFKGISDNTGSPASKVQYTFGPETPHPTAAGQVQRVISATTTKDIANAGNLAELKFAKKPGFTPPLVFNLEDRLTEPTIDGLQGPDLENIPHNFNTAGVKH